MTKRLARTTLLASLLCASPFAQRMKIFGAGRLACPRSSYNSLGRSAPRTENLRVTRNNTTENQVHEPRANSCHRARSKQLSFVAWSREGNKVPVWKSSVGRAFFFTSGMLIDADGAPNAYNTNDTGLDELPNAGYPSHWNGIVTDGEGNPSIQQGKDPFPGYYISCTSLSDNTKMFSDPVAYVDASKIPYIALPEDLSQRAGMRLGDFAFVVNLRNRKWSFAIFADIGTVGEGSIALADNLGIWSDARHGGQSEGILYTLFPGSGNLRPRTISEIQREGEQLVDRSSRTKNLLCCTESNDAAGGDREF